MRLSSGEDRARCAARARLNYATHTKAGGDVMRSSDAVAGTTGGLGVEGGLWVLNLRRRSGGH